MRKISDTFFVILLILFVLPAISIKHTVKQAHRRRLLPRTLLGWAVVLILFTLALMGLKQTSWWPGHDQTPMGAQRVSQPSTPI